MLYSLKINREKELNEFVEKSFNEIDKFYGLKWIYNRPKVFVIEETDPNLIETNKQLFPYKNASGWIQNNNVYVISKKLYRIKMRSYHLDESYGMLIKHELSHCFYNILSMFNSKPDWLWEGCATYLSGQLKFMQKPQKFVSFLDFYEQNMGMEVYKESGFVVELLINQYGKDKLISLIKGLKENKTQSNFHKLFYTIYGIDLSYETINNLYMQ